MHLSYNTINSPGRLGDQYIQAIMHNRLDRCVRCDQKYRIRGLKRSCRLLHKHLMQSQNETRSPEVAA